MKTLIVVDMQNDFITGSLANPVAAAIVEPMAAAMSRVDSITMYGEGNQAKLASEIATNGDQIFAGLEKTLGIDLKSVLAGALGSKLLNK